MLLNSIIFIFNSNIFFKIFYFISIILKLLKIKQLFYELKIATHRKYLYYTQNLYYTYAYVCIYSLTFEVFNDQNRKLYTTQVVSVITNCELHAFVCY